MQRDRPRGSRCRRRHSFVVAGEVVVAGSSLVVGDPAVGNMAVGHMVVVGHIAGCRRLGMAVGDIAAVRYSIVGWT